MYLAIGLQTLFSHLTILTGQSEGILWTRDRPVAETSGLVPKSAADIHQQEPDNICSHTTRLTTTMYFNLLKPTGYVMHHQFNIQQLYALPALYYVFCI